MWIRINGQQRQFAVGSTLRDVLDQRGIPTQGVAVALDGEVVPSVAWAATRISPDACVEILTATPGG